MIRTRTLTRRRFIQRLGLALTASSLTVPASRGADAAAGPNATRHKILTCNIRVPLEEDEKTGNGWNARKDLCARIIEAQRADLICLQECWGVQLEFLRKCLPAYESFGLANPDRARNPANAVLFSRARYELLSAGGFWLSETPHVAGSSSWDSARPRFVNWVDLKPRETGPEFRVWNTHLDHIGQEARERGARLIAEAAEPFPKEAPQILTGDFNARESNPAVKALFDRGWVDTYAAVHGPQDPGFTFHAFKGPAHAEGIKPGTRGKIDWILCRGAVKVLGAAVIRDARDGRYPSDHYFVSADLEL